MPGHEPRPLSHHDQEYEFTDEENVVFTRVAVVMRWVALLFITLGVVVLAGGFVMLWRTDQTVEIRASLGYWSIGAVSVLSGSWLQTASRSFRDIATTEGRDISHLMYALLDLRKAYVLQSVVLAITVVVFIGWLLWQLNGLW